MVILFLRCQGCLRVYKFLSDLRKGCSYCYRIVQDTDEKFFVDVTYKETNLLYERRRFSTISSARVYVSKHIKD